MIKLRYLSFLTIIFTIFYAQAMELSISSFSITNLIRLLVSNKKAKLIDWDGVPCKDEPKFDQFKMALSVIPLWIAITSLTHNMSTFCKLAYNKGRLYKANGDKCIGHTDYLEVFAEKAPELKPYLQDIMDACAQAEPHWETIERIQKWHAKGCPIIVWTNNNGPMFLARFKELNRRLAEAGKPPLEIDGYFVVGSNAENASPVGKPHLEYYQKAFAYTQKVLKSKGYTGNRFCFIDDKPENIKGAQAFAQILAEQHEGTTLQAFLHENQDAFKQVLAEAKINKQTQETLT